MSADERVLDQFLGNDAFPIEWRSEQERQLFWVFDDLHCPHPLSPMFYEIGGWWLTCDHMFRRFGTPFAADWLTKNVNGYLYTAAVPADPAWTVDAMEYGARYGARVPFDPGYATKMGGYLDAVLPVYGAHFVDWWRERLVPEMERNFASSRSGSTRRTRPSLADLAVLLEDGSTSMIATGRSTGCSTSRSVRDADAPGRDAGDARHVDDALLGRLQISASDRNWDKIRPCGR